MSMQTLRIAARRNELQGTELDGGQGDSDGDARERMVADVM